MSSSAKAKAKTKDVRFTQDYVVLTPKKEAAYLVSESDWKRLRRGVEKLKPLKRVFQNVAYGMLGIFVTGAFSLVGYYSDGDIQSWAKSVAWIVTICSGLLTMAFFYLDRLEKRMATASTTDVLGEIQLLEESFIRADDDATAARVLPAAQGANGTVAAPPVIAVALAPASPPAPAPDAAE